MLLKTFRWSLFCVYANPQFFRSLKLDWSLLFVKIFAAFGTNLLNTNNYSYETTTCTFVLIIDICVL